MSQTSPFVYHIKDKCKHVDVAFTLPKIVDEEDFAQFICEAFKVEGCERIIASEKVIVTLDEVLETYLKYDDILIHSNVVTQILRAFRNCASYPPIQSFIVHKTDLTRHLQELFDRMLKLDKANFLLHILLQVLHNTIVDNDTAAFVINSIFSDSLYFCVSNNIFASDALAVLYNISLHMEINHDLITDYSEFYHNDLYFVLLLSHLVKNASFWKSYDAHTIEQKELIMDHLIHSETPLKLHEDGINHFAFRLINYFDSFIKNTIFDQLHQFSLTLQLLGNLSSDEHNLLILQRNKDLLIQCSAFLINMHRAEGSSIHETEFPKEMSLLYNFKADLVRLIGNMCYRNTKMQDLARRAEVIPVLTAFSKIDEMNPFIEQWCVLALRNLCEGNEENQELIRLIVNDTKSAP